MNELSIKVKIAGRQYPLTIPREDEEVVRNAAKMVEEQFRYFQDNYAVKDRADLLAMVALQSATASLKKNTSSAAPDYADDLLSLRETLRQALS